MKDLTLKRQGLWYARKDLFRISAVKEDPKRGFHWTDITIPRGKLVVFVEDLVKTSFHLLLIDGQVVRISRMNQARWHRKFER